ncbi:MAG TPA: dipeptide ABC transporter ATP-binding protein [Firmicutes bacterium]|nr:dipeptide ABC transporter ATP-binding protein [Bacillota bacterium]
MTVAAEKEVIIEAQDLKKYFTKSTGLAARSLTVKAVDGVSFDIKPGETLGLVGESGCGKTTVGRTLIGLYRPTAGKVLYKGENLYRRDGTLPDKYRRQMQMIFQDPYSSLNPRMTVGDIVGEPIDIHRLAGSKKERQEKVQELLELVGLSAEHMNRYPHEFSGGQRQRVGIARSLAVEPELIVCDEPISAVDVSIQAQIINMLEKLQAELGLSYMIIAHDLSMIKYISDRVAVMYLGKIVELVTSENLYANPQHPYTRALLSAVPIADPEVERRRKRIILEGDVPSPVNPPSGCYFHTRCNRALPICSEIEPEKTDLGDGQWVACHNP